VSIPIERLNKSPIEHIYIHVPFCMKKCAYCSFYSCKYSHSAVTSYLAALTNEISFWKKSYNLEPRTIYLGGGTPSLLKKPELEKILNEFDLTNIEEITLEANPLTISETFTSKINDLGITRVSIGAQSFLNKELKLLGRLHDVDGIYSAIRNIRDSSSAQLSLDLIYGLPEQNEQDLQISLAEIIALSPEHVSIYCLSLEEDVPLYNLKDNIPSDEVLSQFYYLIRDQLLEAGYPQYEISNFAIKGFESKHNLSYWNDKFYLGLGPAAAGYLPGRKIGSYQQRFRYTNPADLNRYKSEFSKDENPVKKHPLTREDHQKEYIFLTLRKTAGMDIAEFDRIFNSDFISIFKPVIDKYQKLGLLELNETYVKLTPEAYFISNEIFSEFV